MERQAKAVVLYKFKKNQFLIPNDPVTYNTRVVIAEAKSSKTNSVLSFRLKKNKNNNGVIPVMN